MSAHNWHSGNFPDGRGFNFSIVGWREADKSHSVGVVTTPDGVQMAAVVNEPLIHAESEIWDPYEMVLRTEDGVEHVITAEVLSVMPHSLVGPNEIAYGNHTGTAASHLLLDCQTRYEWDGVVGYGLTERTVMRPRQQNDTYDLLVGVKKSENLQRLDERLEMQLRDAHIVITGGSKGIGAEVVDLSDHEQYEGLLARAEAEQGPLDVVINSAALGATRHFGTLTSAEVRKTLTTNLLAPLELCRQAVRVMVPAGAGPSSTSRRLRGSSLSRTSRRTDRRRPG